MEIFYSTEDTIFLCLFISVFTVQRTVGVPCDESQGWVQFLQASNSFPQTQLPQKRLCESLDATCSHILHSLVSYCWFCLIPFFLSLVQFLPFLCLFNFLLEGVN